MGIEGELVVRIDTQAGRVSAAAATPERPRVASALFVGRPASQAPALARTIFAICGRSQEVAARAAIGALRGRDTAEAERWARERAIAAETLQEHAWRVFVDAPRQLGREPPIHVLAQVRRAVAALLDARESADMRSAGESLLAWSDQALFGCAPAAFLELTSVEALHRWTREAGTPAAAIGAEVLGAEPALGSSDVALLPSGETGWIVARLVPGIDAGSAFEQAPSLEGRAHETGPLARTLDHPLVAAAVEEWGRGVGARFIARLVEMARLALEITGSARQATRHGAAATGEGRAMAWAETARGLLVHRVALDGERVTGYRIVAPTEWNFHPDGAFTRGVRGLRGDDAAIEARVRRVAASLDPCVEVRYEARHA